MKQIPTRLEDGISVTMDIEPYRWRRCPWYIKKGADKHCPPRSRNKWMYDSYSFLFLARMVAMIFSVVAISANIVLYDFTNSLSLPLRQSWAYLMAVSRF